jgi:hypothetical protein
MTTVTRMETVFIIKVKSKYFVMSGSTSDVAGRILDRSSRNTTSDSRMLMPNVTWKAKCKKGIIISLYKASVVDG